MSGQQLRIKQVENLQTILDGKYNISDLGGLMIDNSFLVWTYNPTTNQLEATVTDAALNSVTVDSIYTSFTDYLDDNYTGVEFTEGDTIVLKNTVRGTEAYMRLSNTVQNGDFTDFVRIEAEISDSYIRNLFSVDSPLTYNNVIGKVGIVKADSTHDGYLSSADFTTFFNKSNLTQPQIIQLFKDLFSGVQDGVRVLFNSSTNKFDIINTDKGSEQFVFKKLYADQGLITASSSSDYFRLEGGTNINTRVVGNTVLIEGLSDIEIKDLLGNSGFIQAGQGVTVTYNPTSHTYMISADNIDLSNLKAFKTIGSDLGTITATSYNDSMKILGGTNIKSRVVGDTLYIDGKSDSQLVTLFRAQLVPGAGIHISPIGVSPIEISADTIADLDNYKFQRINANTGTTLANRIDDTLSILGSNNINTSIVGDTVTIKGLSNIELKTIFKNYVKPGTNVSLVESLGNLVINAYPNLPPADNIFKTIIGDTGQTTANSNNDILSILGGSNVTTSISGDTVTINGKTDSELRSIIQDIIDTNHLGQDTNLATNDLVANAIRRFTIIRNSTQSFVIKSPDRNFMVFDTTAGQEKITFDTDVTINGSFTMNGTFSEIQSEIVNIADNFVLLNSNITGLPTENVGIEIKRGSLNNVFLRWNETSDQWELTQDGVNFFKIWNEGNDGNGSGLDADLLDGQQGTYYTNATNLTSGTLNVGRLTGTYNIDISGNSNTSNRFITARKIELTNQVTGQVMFDGSSDVQIITSVDPGILGSDGTDHNHDSRYIRQIVFTNQANNQVQLLPNNDNYLRFTGTGVNISLGQHTGTSADPHTIDFTMTDTGSAQNIFKRINVQNTFNFQASRNNDVLNFEGDKRIKITTDPLSNTIFYKYNQIIDPMTPGEYWGDVIPVNSITLQVGKIYHKDGSSWVLTTTNNLKSNINLIGIAVDEHLILLKGFFKYSFTWIGDLTGTGKPLYLTSVLGMGDDINPYNTVYYRIIGYDYDTDLVYFNPDRVDDTAGIQQLTPKICFNQEFLQGTEGTIIQLQIHAEDIFKPHQFRIVKTNNGGTNEAIEGTDYSFDHSQYFTINPNQTLTVNIPTLDNTASMVDKILVLDVTDISETSNYADCYDVATLTIKNFVRDPVNLYFDKSDTNSPRTETITEGEGCSIIMNVWFDESDSGTTSQPVIEQE